MTMKTLRLFAATAVLMLLSVSGIKAQPKDKEDWQERLMSEKIAFITAELELTPEEAQVFWPVYNQIAKQKMEAHKAMFQSYFALREALDKGNISDKEIDRLLSDYLTAKTASREADNEDAEKFRKVLPSKKVAKLYVAEEKFRRQHIRNMKGGHQGPETGRPEPKR